MSGRNYDLIDFLEGFYYSLAFHIYLEDINMLILNLGITGLWPRNRFKACQAFIRSMALDARNAFLFVIYLFLFIRH